MPLQSQKPMTRSPAGVWTSADLIPADAARRRRVVNAAHHAQLSWPAKMRSIPVTLSRCNPIARMFAALCPSPAPRRTTARWRPRGNRLCMARVFTSGAASSSETGAIALPERRWRK